jgi:hypothetical protein
MYKIPEFNPETAPDPSVALEKVGEWLLAADAMTVGFVMGHSKQALSHFLYILLIKMRSKPA